MYLIFLWPKVRQRTTVWQTCESRYIYIKHVFVSTFGMTPFRAWFCRRLPFWLLCFLYNLRRKFFWTGLGDIFRNVDRRRPIRERVRYEDMTVRRSLWFVCIKTFFKLIWRKPKSQYDYSNPRAEGGMLGLCEHRRYFHKDLAHEVAW